MGSFIEMKDTGQEQFRGPNEVFFDVCGLAFSQCIHYLENPVALILFKQYEINVHQILDTRHYARWLVCH